MSSQVSSIKEAKMTNYQKWEANLIVSTFIGHNLNMTRTARHLGLGIRTVQRKLQRLGVPADIKDKINKGEFSLTQLDRFTNINS